MGVSIKQALGQVRWAEVQAKTLASGRTSMTPSMAMINIVGTQASRIRSVDVQEHKVRASQRAGKWRSSQVNKLFAVVN